MVAERKRKNHPPKTSGGPMWSGTISFGLVSIPVTLWPAVREGRVSMRMLSDTGHPLGRRYVSAKSAREVHPEHLLRGYRVDENKFIPVTEEELESLAPEKSRDIDLRRFVPRDQIDPLYFDRAYYLLPAEGSSKAYRLLAEVIERTNRAGVATFVMRDKEYFLAIFADRSILRAQTLRFPDEIRPAEAIDLPDGEAEPKHVAKFEEAIRGHSRRFNPNLLEDEGKARLLKLIEKKKQQHRDVVEVAEPEAAEAEDEEETGGRSMKSLMTALEQSMAAATKTRKKR